MSDENTNEEKTVEETPQADAPKANETKSEATPEEKPTEEPKEQGDTPAETDAAADAPAVDVSQEEVTGRETAEETEEEVTPDQVEELPHRNVKPGMVVRVHERIRDVSPKGEARERIQIFEGLVVGMKGAGIARTMTVRKDSKGWMVEKIYPLSSPNVTKIEAVKTYKVRRAKLNYLRGLKTKKGKRIRFKRKMKEVKSET